MLVCACYRLLLKWEDSNRADYLGTGSAKEFTEEKKQELVGVLKGLGEHLPTLKVLVEFLVREVCVHSGVNKMTPSNLSIVFGPTLMRPEKETMETTLNSPLVNNVVQCILEVCWRSFSLFSRSLIPFFCSCGMTML